MCTTPHPNILNHVSHVIKNSSLSSGRVGNPVASTNTKLLTTVSITISSYNGFCELLESRHLWLRDDVPQHVDTWLRENDLNLCRAEEETRVLLVVVVVACQLVVIFGRLCERRRWEE